MARPTPPTDLYASNGWYLELPEMNSPHFETLEGLQKTSQSMEFVDAGTNKKLKFSGQIIDFGELSLTRAFQGTPEDRALEALVDAMISQGITVNAVAVKLHKGQEVFRVLLQDFRFAGRTWPTLDVSSEEKFLVNYTATCNDWDII